MADVVAAERVARHFSIAGPVHGVEPIAAGLVNDTFLVGTNADAYVLQRINRSVFGDPRALMQNVGTVSAHLAGRHVPELVPSGDGGWIIEDGADIWRMWRRVRDAAPCGELTPVRVGSAAQLLGRFHRGLSDLSPSVLTETIPHFHDLGIRLASLRETIAHDPCGRVEDVGAEIERAFAANALVMTATEFTSRLPRQVAHNDAQINNILFRRDDAVCLVDLDTVMPTARFWDVGDLLRSASTRGEEDDPDPQHNLVEPALFHAIVDGYRDAVARVVTPGSIEYAAVEVSGLFITYEQALRFLTDYLRGDVYYRTTRAGQNLDRARAQLNLLASMQGSVAS